jgi:UDP-N-acetylmuramoyl-tripeptide--D-alanyl-D-alanine ligase
MATLKADLLGAPLEERLRRQSLTGMPIIGTFVRVVREDGIWLLDDSYNASPLSVRGALDILDHVGGGSARRTVVLLGEMRELGSRSRAMHVETGGDIARAGVDLLIAVGGADADALVDGAVRAGLARAATRRARDAAESLAIALAELRTGDRVLVKGSRALGMERVVAGLRAWDASRGEGR